MPTHSIIKPKNFSLHNDSLDKLPDWLLLNTTLATPEDLSITINCTGGDVLCAIEVTNLINSYPKQINTIITGCAESSALLIAIAGHKRYAYKNSWGMTHTFSTTLDGSYHDHKDAQKHNNLLQKTLVSIIKEKTTASEHLILTRLLGRKTTWITPTEMLNLSIIDAIVPPFEHRKTIKPVYSSKKGINV